MFKLLITVIGPSRGNTSPSVCMQELTFNSLSKAEEAYRRLESRYNALCGDIYKSVIEKRIVERLYKVEQAK